MGIIEILLGVAFPLLVSVGVALAVLGDATPGEIWFARGCFLIAATNLLGLVLWKLYTSNLDNVSRMALAGAAGIIVVPALLYSLLWIDARAARTGASNPPAPSTEKPKPTRLVTLQELFENDWPDLPAYYTITILGLQGKSGPPVDVNLPWRLNGDFVARSKFLAFLLDSKLSAETAIDLCVFIANNYQVFIDATDNAVDVEGKLPTDSGATHLKEMVFSRRIYVYYLPVLSLEQMGSIEVLYRQKGLSIQFRGSDYAWIHRESPPPLRPSPLTAGSVLLPRALGTGLQIKVTNLKPSAPEVKSP